jgi:alkylhydroperoxidase family enzyme
MPKFLPVQLDSAGERVRQVYSDFETAFGTPPDNIVRTIAPSSAFLQGYYHMLKAVIGESSLNDKTRELVILKVAKLNGSEYVQHQRALLGKKVGISDEMIAALDDHRKSDLFTYMEQEALNWTEDITKNPNSTDEENFKQLKNHFTQQQVVELTTLAAFFNMVTRLCQALEIEIDGHNKSAGHR